VIGDGFDQPQDIPPSQQAFPGSVRHLMPAYSNIPDEFRDMNVLTEWNRFVSHWFFGGDPFAKWNIGVREGVDPNKALTHLQSIMRSWEPKHEHKEAAVAWLMSRWFDGIELRKDVTA
jgi:hypothetical protein